MRIKTVLFGALFGVLLSFWLVSTPAQAKYAAYVVDTETGDVLYSINQHTRNYPASLTKIMTLYMTFEALDQGKVKLGDRIKVSKRAAGQPPSKLGLKRGSTIKLEHAILALVTKSANDAATALAEHLGGTEIKFARKMTKRAHKLGMTRTNFANASGLPNRAQLSTAHDMAVLGQRISEDFPHYYHYFSRKNFSYGGKKYKNHNGLLGQYKGTDGIKTGYIRASGFNLVASVEREGRRLIGVVFGGKTGKSRDRHMRKILDKSFAKAKSGTRTKFAAIARKAPVRENALRGDFTQVATTGQQPIIQPEIAQMVSALASSSNQQALLAAFKADPNLAALTPAVLSAIAPAANMTLGDNPFPATRQSDLAVLNKLLTSLSANGDIDPKSVAQINALRFHQQAPRSPEVAAEVKESPNQGWKVQVGAFRTKAQATKAAQLASRRLNDEQQPYIVEKSGRLYKARLVGFGSKEAKKGCNQLKQKKLSCFVIAPKKS